MSITPAAVIRRQPYPGLGFKEDPSLCVPNNRADDELPVLDEVARIITSTLAVEGVYERFAQELRKLVQFDWININIIDRARRRYTVRYAFGPRSAGLNVGDSGSLEQSMTGQVVESRNLVTGEDLNTATEPASGQRFSQANSGSCLMLPLVSKGNVIGTLGLRSHNPCAYAKWELDILETLAGQIAPAVENAVLYEAGRLAEIEERRKSGEMEALLNIANILGGPGAFAKKVKMQ